MKRSSTSRSPSRPRRRSLLPKFPARKSSPQPVEPGPCGHVRRRLQRQLAQKIGERIEPRRDRQPAVGVPQREFRDFHSRSARAELQITALIERQKVRKLSLNDPQAVAGKIEIADDFRIEQRDRVGRDRIAETGVKFLGHRRAADRIARFEHQRLETRGAEIGRADEPIMAAADNDGVVALQQGSTRAPPRR